MHLVPSSFTFSRVLMGRAGSGIARPRKRKAKKVKEEGADPTAGDGRRWATGTKYRFLASRLDAWKVAEDLNDPSTFYDNVTLLFFKKYGWDLPIETDLPEADEDPSENNLDEVRSDTGLLPEEAARRHDLYYSARDVRIILVIRHAVY